jgi:hypothetical protein
MLMDQVGDLVAVRSTSNGIYKVWRANPAVRNRMPAIGVIVKKWSMTECIVQLYGPVLSIYTGLVPQTTYTVGDNGRPANPIPTPSAPGEIRYIQQIGTPLSPTVLDLLPCLQIGIRSF